MTDSCHRGKSCLTEIYWFVALRFRMLRASTKVLNTLGNDLVYINLWSVSDQLRPRFFVSRCTKIIDGEILVIISSPKPPSKRTIQEAVSFPDKTDCRG